MIFKTINSSVDETRKTLALFNKDWNTYKRNWQNANGVFGKIGSVFTPANAITKSDIEAIKAYNSQIDSCVTSQTAFNRTMLNASPAAQNLVASYNGGKVSAQGMATAQNVAKASTIGLTIAQTALNAAIGMGIGLLISLVVKGIDKLVHANEEAIEKAEELRRKYEEFKSTNESNITTLNGLKKEFEELSKGVSQYGDNISLTTEQYERYKEIVQQIVGMSPSLAEGYSTENGYIADKNGLLERAIELQEQEYRNELRKITNLDNLKTSMSGYIAEYKEAFDGGLVTDDMSATATKAYTNLKNALYDIFNTNNREDFSSENMIRQIMDSIGIKDIEAEMVKYYNKYGYFQDQDFWNDYADVIAQNIQAITDSLNADTVGLDDSVFDQNIEKVDSAAQSYLDMKDAISMANESIQRDLGYIAEYANGYSNLSTEQQKFVNEFLKGYDISDIMSESNNPFNQGWEFDEDKMASVKSQITKFVETLLQDDTTKTALADLYAIPTDGQSISEFVEQFRNALEIVKAYCKDNDIEIPIAITDSEQTINDLEAQYQRAVDFAKDKFGGYDPTAFFKEHSINTQEEIDAWQEIAQGARDAAVAEKEYIQGSTLNEKPISLFDQLTTSQESIDKFQSSLKSAADAYATLLSGNYSSSDLLDSIQSISQAAMDMGNSLDWDNIDVDPHSLSLLGDEIERISKEYAESVLSGAGIDIDSKFGQMLSDNIIQAQKASTELDVLNDQIDSLQEAYNDLTDIVDTYNETGYITFDQLQILLEMEPQYLSCLVDENGQLQLNEAAMTALANKRLDDAEAQAIQQAITELGQIALQDEKQAVEENATAFTNAVNDLASYNTELANTIAEATVGASAIRDLNAAISGAESQGASDVQIDTVLDNLNTKLQLINNVRDKVAAGGLGSVTKSGSGSKSKTKEEKDTTKEYDWIEQAIENVEKEIKELDEVADSSYSTFSQKNEALTKEIGKVTEEIELQQKAYEEYMRKADSIGLPDSYKELVQNGAINIEDIKDEKLQEQIEGYQKWYDKAQNASDAIKELKTDLKDLHVESYKLQTENLKDRLDSDSITEKQYLAGLKSAYEQFYGNLEDYAEQYHEAKLEYLEEEKKYLNSVANAAASLLDVEIDRIQENADEQEEQLKGQIELLEARKKPLQDELEALDDKVRKEGLALNLQKAQYDLARAENQRSKLIYTADKGMIYTNDTKAIRDAEKDVDDAKLEIHKQSIQDQIDVLDDEISRYDELIDQINKAADAQVKALEKIKNKWQEVIDQQEYAKNVTILTGEFGSDAIVKILSGNDDDLLAQWKNSYINTLKSIDSESQGYIGDMTKQIESLYKNQASAVTNVVSNVNNTVDKSVNTIKGEITLPDGTTIYPIEPGDRAWELQKAFEPLVNKILNGETDIVNSALFEHQRQMEQWTKNLTYSNVMNNVTNNNGNREQIVHQEINVTLPNVTNATSAESLLKDLESIGRKKYQVNW